MAERKTVHAATDAGCGTARDGEGPSGAGLRARDGRLGQRPTGILLASGREAAHG